MKKCKGKENNKNKNKSPHYSLIRDDFPKRELKNIINKDFKESIENLGKKIKIHSSEEITKTFKIHSSDFELLNKNKKCPICLDLIINAASIKSCKHEFCYDCLTQWTNKSSQCPLCKIDFDSYNYKNFKGDKISKNVDYKLFTEYEHDEENYIINTDLKCMECGNTNNIHLMWICDTCNYSVSHTYCAKNVRNLNAEWKCSMCIIDQYKSIFKNSNLFDSDSE
jgi:hypothetical protein